MPVLMNSLIHEKLFNVCNKSILITGAAGILGSFYSKAFAEAGANVIVTDINKELCEQLASEIASECGKKVTPIAVDLSNEESVQQLANAVHNQFGTLDVLINNAATKSEHFFYPLNDFPLLDWEKVMSVNITGMFLTAKTFGQEMASAKRGSIINVSSIYGVVGPDQRIYEDSWYEAMGGKINTPLVYSVSKGAVLSLTRYLATYWGAQGVRTNTLTPGGVSSGQNQQFQDRYKARVPMNRMAEPEEMLGPLFFLASDASSYVNGQNIIVDGGLTAW